MAGLNTPHALSPPPGITRPRAVSQPPPGNKSVQFNLPPSGPTSPEEIRIRRQREFNHDNYDSYDSESSAGKDRRHRGKRHRDHHHDSPSSSPAHSDETVDLPERFDHHGQRVSSADEGKDPMMAKIEDLLNGKGAAGKLIKSLTDGFLGGGDGDKDRDRDIRRRRRRYS